MDSAGTGANGGARPRGQNGGRGGLKGGVNGSRPHNGEAQAKARAAGKHKALEAEIQARRAEARWLHAHYGERLRELVAEVAALSVRAEAAERPQALEPTGGRVSAEAEAQIARLTAQVAVPTAEGERQKAANERYLARIYELKRALQGGEAGSRP